MDIFQQKRAVREELKDIAENFSLEYVTAASRAVCENILQSNVFSQARAIFGYLAFQNEISVDWILEEAIKAGKDVAVPQIVSKTEMQAARLEELGNLPLDRYGIRTVPESAAIFAPDYFDLILVPGAGFSLTGCRMGRGAGYYDRFLAKTRGFRLGVTSDRLIREQIPVESHDQLVEAVVTETKLICCIGV